MRPALCSDETEDGKGKRRRPQRSIDSTEVSAVGSLRTYSGSLIDESALGSQYRDASLETLGQQGIRLYREKKSASPNQHDNDHDDQDKYKCSSSNEHDSFLSLDGLSGVEVPALGSESTLAR